MNGPKIYATGYNIKRSSTELCIEFSVDGLDGIVCVYLPFMVAQKLQEHIGIATHEHESIIGRKIMTAEEWCALAKKYEAGQPAQAEGDE